MVLLVAMPSIMLPGVTAEAAQIAMFLALAAGGLVFVEYRSESPSFIAFRDAPPVNRIRILTLGATVVLVTLVSREALDPNPAAPILATLGSVFGAALDFPFSPVRLMTLLVPPTADVAQLETLRAAAGLAYAIGLASILAFSLILRALDWPLANGAFNVWINLPTFEPTGGGDVLQRLERDAHINVALGFLLPFLIPATLQVVAPGVVLLNPAEPQTAIWIISAWGFLPASLIMRGIALTRVVQLIAEKRRRAYRQAGAHVA